MTTVDFQGVENGWVAAGEQFPHMKEIFRLFPEINKESDRGVALILCSFLDDMLKDIIKAYLVEGKQADMLIDGFNAPLGTFSTRIKTAYVLGLISEEEYKESEYLKDIRNKFAHKIYVSFKDQQIKDLCKNLTMVTNADGTEMESRIKYTGAAAGLLVRLVNRAHYVSQRRSQYGDWTY